MIVPPWWDEYSRIRPQVEEALGREGYSLEWLDDRILRNKAQLWLGRESALVTEVNACTLAAAGNMGELIHELRPQAEQWGRGLGLSQVFIDGRPGWRRALAPFGYLPRNDGVRKELT